MLNIGVAVDQAKDTVHSKPLALILIGMGLLIKAARSAAALTGFFDRLAAVILAGYRAVIALLWKRFRKEDGLRLKGPSKGHNVFWDFLKNFAVAGGFLILATGGMAHGVKHLILHPLSSSHPCTSVPLDLHVPTSHATNPPAGVSR